MKPLVTFPDPMLAVLEILRDRLPATEAAALNLGTILPEDHAEGAFPGLPYAAVRLDATAPGYPVTETATIRVAIWAASEAKGLRLAQVVRAVLAAYEGGPKVRSLSPLTGPYPSSDPESGAPLSYLTVAARLRPTTL